ncbi:MAG: peptidoglycan bridge formation glycyltransferase FemA/FemB family protein [Parcubacteria group bacterium]|jgi:lipid II:glycine glycyltransferase (peptidoglycan interpeptide bridge formation enzyme)
MTHQSIKKPEGGLLQSEEWMAVLHAEKKETYRIVSAYAIHHMIQNRVPLFGAYMYVPRVFDLDHTACAKIIAVAREHGAGWVRIDVGTEAMMRVLDECGQHVLHAPHDMQPRHNLIIDIAKDEEELLKNMKSKTRYNVRLAQKKGVTVFASKEQKYVDAFCALVGQTAVRKEVSFHDKSHYEKIINTLSDDHVQLYIAEYNGNVIAANLVSFYGGVATYLHGATADRDRDVMAPFLLQWQAILDAKVRGCEWYDLGGVFPHTEDKGKQGITRFKQGFAPQETFFATRGSYDIVLSPLRYYGYRLAQKFKS